MPAAPASPRRETLFCLAIVTLLSFLAYVPNFWNPSAFFWDENYHIASAQKYLNRTFFMEPHPPLGKLVIAAGEALLNLNERDDQFIGTDYAKDPPTGFNFAGYRLFPVLLSWLTAPILFLALALALGNPILALLASFLYIFDTALIVHLRGAMLEPPYLFGSVLTILAFLLLRARQEKPLCHLEPVERRRFLVASLLFGLSFAIVMLTKVLGLVLILLPLVLLFGWRKDFPRIFRFAAASGSTFLLLYIAVWQAHFALGKNINPVLPDQGFYQASAEYKDILLRNAVWSPRSFPVMLKDSWRFVAHYSRGVPRLDLCKADENGSPAFLWPFGGRSINYRWETPDGVAYKYLYLQANPVVWWGGYLGVFLSAALLLASWTLPLKEKLKNPTLLFTFLLLHCGFMAGVLRLDRVMYTYHYFFPLIVSFFLLGLSLLELTHILRWRITAAVRRTIFLGLGIAVFLGFLFFKPFAYYEPITDDAFKRRAFFPLWELHCVHCPKKSMFVQGVR